MDSTQAIDITIDQHFDFDCRSLVDSALIIEAELNGLNIKSIKDTLGLQHIVLNSKLAKFEQADKAKLQQLLHCVYQEQSFSGDWQQFFKIENALISNVLTRRKGIPITLGILLIDFLTHTGFDAKGICFPSGFIVSVSLNNELVYIDPFTGEMVSWDALELRLRGQQGNHARLTLDQLKPDTHKTIIMRLINVIKAAYIQGDVLELALVCCDMLLRVDKDDAFEVRDRGFLFQQLDCFKLASNDFKYFIEQCPSDPIVGLLKQQIKQMNNSFQVIH